MQTISLSVLFLSVLSACGTYRSGGAIPAPSPTPVPASPTPVQVPGIQGAPGEKGDQGVSTVGEKGDTGDTGIQGSTGQNGSQGATGVGFTNSVDTLVQAERFYAPSDWGNGELLIGAGLYEVPSRIATLVGISGTGWASVTVGNRQFCYQGRNANSTEFRYRGEKPAGQDCHLGSLKKTGSILLVTAQTTLVVRIDGGGCNSLCTHTVAVFELRGIAQPVVP